MEHEEHMEKLTIEEALTKIQQEIRVPKGRENKFGGYKYRNAEDIIDAAKLIANPLGCSITCDDEVVMIGNRYYVKSTATLSNGPQSISKCGYAREEEAKKGMDGSQITGSSSSYARKYALNGLFAIDDGIDSDTTNTGDAPRSQPKPQARPASKPATKPESKPEAAVLPPEIMAAGEKLKKVCDAYNATKPSVPLKAVTFDILSANNMKSLAELKSCTNVNVFSALIDAVEAAMQTKEVHY